MTTDHDISVPRLVAHEMADYRRTLDALLWELGADPRELDGCMLSDDELAELPRWGPVEQR